MAARVESKVAHTRELLPAHAACNLSSASSFMYGEWGHVGELASAHFATAGFLASMHAQVNDEFKFLTKRLPTHAAFEWFFSGVCPFVLVKNCQLSEVPSTFFAFERLFPGMKSFMSCQTRGLGKSSTAFAALIRPFVSMRSVMNAELILCAKCLPTCLTFVWFFSGMKPRVNDEVALRSEVLLADAAFKHPVAGMRAYTSRCASWNSQCRGRRIRLRPYLSHKILKSLCVVSKPKQNKNVVQQTPGAKN